MNNNGYIKIYRPKQDDPFYFKEPFTKWQAWCDLITLAVWKDKQEVIRGIVVDKKRGSVYASKMTLAERWKWDKKKVLRFLNMLVKLNRVTLQNSNVIGCVTILNYDKYQSNDTANDTLLNNIKNIKNIKKDISSLESDFSATFSFENVWDFYGKKGNKKTAKGRYDKLSKKDKINAVLYIPYYLAFTVPQFRKGFEVYISRRQWENLLQDKNGKTIPFFDNESGNMAYRIADVESFKTWFNNLVRGTSIPQVNEITPDRQVILNTCYTLYPKLMEQAVKTVMTNQRFVEMANKGMITFDYIFNPTNINRICEQGAF